MEYGVNFLDFDMYDEECSCFDLPEDFLKLVHQCILDPTNLAHRFKMLEASILLNGQGVDLEKQKFNINTLILLKLMALLPKIQEHLLAARMGLREEIFQLNELFWRWLTSRSSSAQRDEPKRVKKFHSIISDKLIMLNKAIWDHHEVEGNATVKRLTRRTLQTTGNFGTLLDKLQG